MSVEHKYLATVSWQRRADEKYTDNRYSRAHEWQFDGGLTVPASSSPLVVPAPLSDPKAVDPEEALVASLSSCHMLFFLFHAANKKFVVDRYRDDAVGFIGKNEKGAKAMVKVILRPSIVWGGERAPSAEEIQQLHDRAHHDCYIANSVTAEITVEPPA